MSNYIKINRKTYDINNMSYQSYYELTGCSEKHFLFLGGKIESKKQEPEILQEPEPETLTTSEPEPVVTKKKVKK